MTLTESQRAGTAKPSLIGRLLDDYDATGIVDVEHEYDLKMVGAAMYVGEKLSFFLSTRTGFTS